MIWRVRRAFGRVTMKDIFHGRPGAWSLQLRLAHWFMALCALAAGFYAIYLLNPPEWSDVYKRRYAEQINIHKALGIGALIALLLVAACHGSRPPRAGTPNEIRLARWVQALLVSLIVALAGTGYVGSSLFGDPIAVPGLPAIPSPWAREQTVAGAVMLGHQVFGYVFLGTWLVHLVAAMRGQFVRKDRAISRMLGFQGAAPAESVQDLDGSK
jgi:cytochrome b561